MHLHSHTNIEQLNTFTEKNVTLKKTPFCCRLKNQLYLIFYEGNLSPLVSLGFIENIQCPEHEQLLVVPEYQNISRVSHLGKTNEVQF